TPALGGRSTLAARPSARMEQGFLASPRDTHTIARPRCVAGDRSQRMSADAPVRTPAVAALMASMSAPMPVPSLAEFLYGLEGARRQSPVAKSLKSTSARVMGKKFLVG